MPVDSGRLMPYHHSLGLLSSLRVFRGDVHSELRRIRVPVTLVVRYWELLCGLTRTTTLVTLHALEVSGSVSITRYDSGGSAEFWDGLEVVEQVASILLAHGGEYSVIPRLVQVAQGGDGDGNNDNDSEDTSSSLGDSTLMTADNTLGMMGLEGGGGAMSVRAIVNTATAELRKVKEEMDRLNAAGPGVSAGGTGGEVFMFPREAAAFHEAEAKAQQQRNSINAGGSEGGARNRANTGVSPLDSINAQLVDLPPELEHALASLNLEGVYVVLNQRQVNDAVEAAANSAAVKSKIDYGVPQDDLADSRSTPRNQQHPPKSFTHQYNGPIKPQLIFSSACDDSFLHSTVVSAYRTMLRGTGNNWALGPQDNYYYTNIEHHIKEGAYDGPFEMSLAWRLALLMNTSPHVFEPAYGDPSPSTESPVRSPVVGPDAASNAKSHTTTPSSPYWCTAGDDGNAAAGDRLAATQQMLQLSPTKPSDPSAIGPVTPSAAGQPDDLLPFFLKRCPLVAVAASKGERAMLQATKRGHGKGAIDHRGSSLARKSTGSPYDNAVSAAGETVSPRDMSFAQAPRGGPVGANGAVSPTSLVLNVPGPVAELQPTQLTVLAAVSDQMAPAPSPQQQGHFSAEPFQRMLDGALEDMHDFPAVVRLVLQRGIAAPPASLVLHHCVVDMPEGQQAVVDAVSSSLQLRSGVESAVQLLWDTQKLEPSRTRRDSETHQAGRDTVRRSLQLIDALIEYLSWEDHNYLGDRNASRHGASIRTLLQHGHPLFFPHPVGFHGMLLYLEERMCSASAVALLPYLQWLQRLHSVALCFTAAPLQSMEDVFHSDTSKGEGQWAALESEAKRVMQLLYAWSVESLSPAVRWAASFILHNARGDLERAAFIEDVVYCFWSRTDTRSVRHGIPILKDSNEESSAMLDPVGHIAEFVNSLPPASTPLSDQRAVAWTRREWAVLPPRVQEAIRRGFLHSCDFLVSEEAAV